MDRMPPEDLPFAVAFVVVFVWLVAVRFAYRWRSGDFSRRLINPAEGMGNIVFRWSAGTLQFLAIAAYFRASPELPWMFLPVPTWLRVLGVATSVLGVALIWWSHATLQSDFSSTLRLRENQRLVTWGPYARTRHPMYSGFFALFLGTLLFTKSWAIGGLGLMIMGSLMTTRLAREERMLLDYFGRQYEEYMERTGRFWPRLRRARVGEHTESGGV